MGRLNDDLFLKKIDGILILYFIDQIINIKI